MQITIKAKNLEIHDRLRAYVEKKVSKLDRFLPSIDEARLELAAEHTKSAGDRHSVQFTLRTNGAILRVEERDADLQAAIDSALDKMSRQVERYKGKHWRANVRPQGEAAGEASVEEREADAEGEIVRTKVFQTRPMDVEEAIEQMELLGHDFFVFFNAADSAFSVIYRRKNGGYGLIRPELA
jgi:putative sigma-54 modulation protein